MKIRKLSLILVLTLILPIAFGCTDSTQTEDSKGEKQSEENAQENETKSDKKDEDINNNEEDTENKDAEEEKEKNIEANDVEVGPSEGNMAISFELKSFADDKTYNLNDYLGKDPIIINFFASWCGPCRVEMPDLNEVYKEYEERGLKVFAINVGNTDSEEEVKELINDYILTFPVLKDEKSELAKEYGVRSIPVNIFIDKNGIIKHHLVGSQSKENYEKFVEELFEDEDN